MRKEGAAKSTDYLASGGSHERERYRAADGDRRCCDPVSSSSSSLVGGGSLPFFYPWIHPLNLRFVGAETMEETYDVIVLGTGLKVRPIGLRTFPLNLPVMRVIIRDTCLDEYGPRLRT